ncbi:MAG: DUF3429 domain-containing protein [Gammaproteobacteria bacterium]|nr:DUF3429 domain-containing protein [Gammaproteobacteria bacterium]
MKTEPAYQASVPRTATFLGLAGLIPFCLAPVAMSQDVHHAWLYAELLANYALAIICFLVGIWWGLALIRRSVGAMVISNAVVVVAFFGRSLLPYSPFFLLCAALFAFTLVLERHHGLFKPQPAYYARLRVGLSGVAAVMLIIAATLAA